MMSQASAISRPPPTATPLTAAIIGFGQSKSRVIRPKGGRARSLDVTPGGRARRRRLQVVAGRERPLAGAGQDRDPDLGSSRKSSQISFSSRCASRWSAFITCGPVQRDRRDPVPLLVGDELVAHVAGLNFGTTTSSETGSNTTSSGIPISSSSGSDADDARVEADAFGRLHRGDDVRLLEARVALVDDDEAVELGPPARRRPLDVAGEALDAAGLDRPHERPARAAALEHQLASRCSREERRAGLVRHRNRPLRLDMSRQAACLLRIVVEW